MKNSDPKNKEKIIKENGNELSHKDDFLIVGIGASAGGIQALRDFFHQVTADSGIAYVVILHLSPDHDSKLAQLLQITTPIPVTQVTEKVHVQPNQVYVVPPNRHLTMEDGYIKVSPNTLPEERHAPVDIFFRTLADQHWERAVSVILSGTGANGSMGIKRVKENGGAVFVQNPREAEYSDMPRNAIATELVDEILNVADIPSKIVGYKNSIGTVSIPVLQEEMHESQQAALLEIFTQMRVRTGHDFTSYKRATILRRIERRINVYQLDSLSAYVDFMRENPEEAQVLLKDLLISVTNFFRDKDAFTYLEKTIIPGILQNKAAGNPIRIWIAGCATGEEAYSVAMLFYEEFDRLKEILPIQIFASDIDDAAIAIAREGCYTLNDAVDISAERLRRFFVPEAKGFRVRKELREIILFANHNLIKDPPFSHLDMVTCRNMLIYLNQSGQNRAMETFHFALNPGGYLFLGSSESIDGANDLYFTVSKEHNVFQSRHATRRSIPVPDNFFPAAFRSKFTETDVVSSKVSQEQEKRALERISLADLHQRLLEQYAPPSIIINENYDVIHISEKAGEFLHITGGEPSVNILKLIKPEVRLELRTALYQAIQKQTNVEVKNLIIKVNNNTTIINLHVRPVLRPNDTARGFILLIFEASQDESVKDVVKIYPGESEPVALQLEQELTAVKTQLRSSNEQYEVQTEELKASNEELQAMNEELRSAAEELETSKEELQSINEELITVNQELKVKIEEVSQSNNDLQNLINSSNIGTIFLDRYFRVKLFTPAVRDIFNLIPADIGRPLSDITNRLEYSNLLKDIEDVLKNLQTIEREVTVKENRDYLMQISPYRTAEDKISGLVISFVNVTQLKHAEKAVHESEERIRLILESAKDYAIFTIDLERRINTWNSGAENMYGYREYEVIGKSADILLIPADRAAGAPESETEKALKTGRAENDRWQLRKDGTNFYGSGLTMPLRNDAGTAIGFVKIMRDLTKRKKAEDELRKSEERLRITMESATDYAIITTNTKGIIEKWNAGAKRIFEYTEAEVMGKSIDIIFTEEDMAAGIPAKEMLTASEKGVAPDERWHQRKDGSIFFMSGVMRPIYNPELTGYVKVARDMTEQKQAEERLKLAEERHRIALQSAEMAAWDWNVAKDKITSNEQLYSLIGLDPSENKERNLAFFLQFIYEDDREKVTEALRVAVEETGSYHAEFRVKHADSGQLRWMNGFGKVVEKSGKQATRMIGVVFDITERKKLEQQKDDFISIASHELKTPVTSIKAYAEVLHEMLNQTGNAATAGLIQKLDTQVDRLIELIRALLDTTKISEGELVISPEEFDLTALITERMENMQRIAPAHHLVLSANKEILITADRERIGQVITNLLSNAVKYSPKGGDILISWKETSDCLEVSVSDTGLGIPPEIQEKIFQRFFRVPDAQTHTGMGLGLYISTNIIHRHGGQVWVESKPGQGSVFHFTLPKHHNKSFKNEDSNNNR